MVSAVWSTYFHKRSTDDRPLHHLCPEGVDSWCKYNKALAQNEPYSHEVSLPEAVLLAIQPTYQDLAKPDLLKKCLHGQTQNPNNVIWKRVPKTEFGVADAVLAFNEVNIAKSSVLRSLGCTLSPNTVRGLKTVDEIRIYQAEKAVTFP